MGFLCVGAYLSPWRSVDPFELGERGVGREVKEGGRPGLQFHLSLSSLIASSPSFRPFLPPLSHIYTLLSPYTHPISHFSPIATMRPQKTTNYRPHPPPQPPIHRAIIRDIRSTECIKQDVDEDEEEEKPIDPNQPLYPAWLIYTPRKDILPNSPLWTSYDDPNLFPHMTLNNQRPIRYPDQWPTPSPVSNSDAGPSATVNWGLRCGLDPDPLSAESLAEAHPLAGITSRKSLLRCFVGVRHWTNFLALLN